MPIAALAYLGASIAFYVEQPEWIHASPRDRSGGPGAHGLAIEYRGFGASDGRATGGCLPRGNA